MQIPKFPISNQSICKVLMKSKLNIYYITERQALYRYEFCIVLFCYSLQKFGKMRGIMQKIFPNYLFIMKGGYKVGD